jgi:chromate transporter
MFISRGIRMETNRKEKKHMPVLLELFLLFAEIGATTFGGGYAMLPILQRELVEKRRWTTEEQLMDYYAIGQCTPGIIAVNTATFIGNTKAGMIGGIVATLGVVSPSVVIITIISIFLQNFADLSIVKHAFNGIRAAVCVLIMDSVIKLGKKSIRDLWGWIIFLCVLMASLLSGISPVLLVVLSGVAGIVLKPVEERRAVKAADGMREDEPSGEPVGTTDDRVESGTADDGSESGTEPEAPGVPDGEKEDRA